MICFTLWNTGLNCSSWYQSIRKLVNRNWYLLFCSFSFWWKGWKVLILLVITHKTSLFPVQMNLIEFGESLKGCSLKRGKFKGTHEWKFWNYCTIMIDFNNVVWLRQFASGWLTFVGNKLYHNYEGGQASVSNMLFGRMGCWLCHWIVC